MTLRNRIERLESMTPDPELSEWTSGVMIAPDYTGPYAWNTATGEGSTNPDLLARLEHQSRQRAALGELATFEVIIGTPIGRKEGEEARGKS